MTGERSEHDILLSMESMLAELTNVAVQEHLARYHRIPWYRRLREWIMGKL
jgi:hypothetical protein